MGKANIKTAYALLRAGDEALAGGEQARAEALYAQSLSAWADFHAAALKAAALEARRSKIERGRFISRLRPAFSALAKAALSPPKKERDKRETEAALKELSALCGDFIDMGLNFFAMSDCGKRAADTLWDVLSQAADCAQLAAECRAAMRGKPSEGDLLLLKRAYEELARPRVYDVPFGGERLYDKKAIINRILIFDRAEEYVRKLQALEAELSIPEKI